MAGHEQTGGVDPSIAQAESTGIVGQPAVLAFTGLSQVLSSGDAAQTGPAEVGGWGGPTLQLEIPSNDDDDELDEAA